YFNITVRRDFENRALPRGVSKSVRSAVSCRSIKVAILTLHQPSCRIVRLRVRREKLVERFLQHVFSVRQWRSHAAREENKSRGQPGKPFRRLLHNDEYPSFGLRPDTIDPNLNPKRFFV